MKRSIARKWAKALESGEYKQTFGQLRTKQGNMCCLGVLCNLHAIDHPEIAAQQEKVTEYCGESTSPPDSVLEWAGLGSRDGVLKTRVYTKNSSHMSLMGLNDSEESSFPEIAKVIRKHWKEL